MPNTITKVKLLSGDKVEIDFIKEPDPKAPVRRKPVEASDKFKDPPHPDFVRALAGLDVHAALVGEFVPMINVPDIFHPDQAIIDKFHVSGVTIIGSGTDDEGVIITAQKTLSTGKKMNFNTPLLRINDTGDKAYGHTDALIEQMGKLVGEADLYLGGKIAADPQGVIPGMEEEEKDK